MLRELATKYPVIEQTFAEASAQIGLGLWDIVQNDPANSLDHTHITQPALLAASVSIWRIWQQSNGRMPSILAGHSLGEYSALVCAGVLDFSSAVNVVHQRGQFMQSAVPAGAGKMAAIVGLEN